MKDSEIKERYGLNGKRHALFQFLSFLQVMGWLSSMSSDLSSPRIRLLHRLPDRKCCHVYGLQECP